MASEEIKISKDTIFKMSKNGYSPNTLIKVDIQIKSMLLTKFTTDGVLTDIKNYTLFIQYGEFVVNQENEYNNVDDDNYIHIETLPAPKIKLIEINRMENGIQKPLLISRKNGNEFICAGQTIIIRVKATMSTKVMIEFEGDTSITRFDDLTKQFEWTEPKNRKEKPLFYSLKEFESMYKGKLLMECINTGKNGDIFECKYIIPYETKQTLHSWNTLRLMSDDAFNIDENKLFSRITNPYEIVFKASGANGVTTERIKLDVFQRWDTLYNRDLSEYVKSNST